METTQSHVLRHVFKGEDGGRQAADWMNRNKGTRRGDRVIRLVKKMQQMLRLESMSEWIRQEQAGMSPRSYVEELNNLNRELTRYGWWPMLVGRSTSFERRGKGGLRARSKLRWAWSYGKDPASETIHNVVRLAELGLF